MAIDSGDPEAARVRRRTRQRQQLAAVGVVSIAVVLGVVAFANRDSGGNGADVSNTTTVPSTTVAPTTTATPTTTTPPETTTTTEPPSTYAAAVWPTFRGGQRFADPVSLGQAFATDFLHMVDPSVAYNGDSTSGTLTLRHVVAESGGRLGLTTTVSVRTLGPAKTWWVMSASSPNIRVITPADGATVTSPMRLSGESTAFEAVVNYELRADDVDQPLAEGTVMGGGSGTLEPFATNVSFRSSPSRSGTLVMFTISAADGNVAEATVVRIHFP